MHGIEPIRCGEATYTCRNKVHDAIEIQGDEDKDALRKQCYDVIYSVLSDHSGDAKKRSE